MLPHVLALDDEQEREERYRCCSFMRPQFPLIPPRWLESSTTVSLTCGIYLLYGCWCCSFYSIMRGSSWHSKEDRDWCEFQFFGGTRTMTFVSSSRFEEMTLIRSTQANVCVGTPCSKAPNECRNWIKIGQTYTEVYVQNLRLLSLVQYNHIICTTQPPKQLFLLLLATVLEDRNTKHKNQR